MHPRTEGFMHGTWAAYWRRHKNLGAAFNKGENAFTDGKDYTDNEYEKPSGRATWATAYSYAWEAGWLYAASKSYGWNMPGDVPAGTKPKNYGELRGPIGVWFGDDGKIHLTSNEKDQPLHMAVKPGGSGWAQLMRYLPEHIQAKISSEV